MISDEAFDRRFLLLECSGELKFLHMTCLVCYLHVSTVAFTFARLTFEIPRPIIHGGRRLIADSMYPMAVFATFSSGQKRFCASYGANAVQSIAMLFLEEMIADSAILAPLQVTVH